MPPRPATDEAAHSRPMTPERMAAFTDGVIAVVITILVLELRPPKGGDLHALEETWPVFVAYVLSFVNVGLYWANHHHLLSTAERVKGRVLWANLTLLFWISLTPFVIRWVDEAGVTPWPVAAYGVVLAMAAVAYTWLTAELIAANGGRDSALQAAIGRDWKGRLSLLFYIGAIPLAFVAPWVAAALYVLIAVVWFIPDRRIERASPTRGDPPIG